MAVFGVDISEWQEGVSIQALKDAGVEFVILRCGASFTGSSECFEDSCFESFYNECKRVGMPVGVYWFSAAYNVEKAKEEADYCLRLLKGKQLEYPVWYDVETETHIYYASNNPGLLSDIIYTFNERVESAGYWVGTYTWPWLLQACSSNLDRFDRWLACWTTDEPAEWHGMWQFGGSTNYLRDPNITGYALDQNYAYKEYPRLIKEAGLNGYAKSGNQKQEEPKQEQNNDGPSPQERILELIRGEVGYVPSYGKYNKYAEYLDSLGDVYNGPKNGYDWCDCFADYPFFYLFGKEAAVKMLNQPLSGCGAGCPWSADFFEAVGRFDHNPEVCAQIFFGNPDDEYHVGLVEGYDDDCVYTIEGNTGYAEGYSGGAVMRRTYARNDSRISGYGHPDWSVVGGSSGSMGNNTPSNPRNNRDGGKLEIDGIGGWNTTIDMQHALGTYEDGVISGQDYADHDAHWAMDSVKYEAGGSQLVRAIQKLVGASVDGYWGPETSRKLQQYLINKGYSCGPCGADGYFGRDSVKALQRCLNDGQFGK